MECTRDILPIYKKAPAVDVGAFFMIKLWSVKTRENGGRRPQTGILVESQKLIARKMACAGD
ncbi:MAG: hypothetical protein GWP06_16990 [Actinobacteria bacterium]|nr:hypothetical protein [Actinomycetota bacterium]